MMEIKLHGLTQYYRQGLTKTIVLDHLDAVFAAGQHHAIIGSSGSGKSTLLHLLASLAIPSSGYVTYDGMRFSLFNRGKKRQFLQHHLGMIYQHHHLVMELNVLQNIILSLRLAHIKQPKKIALAMLDQVGLAEYAYHLPHMLSGGQKQRVAIARALAKQPTLVIADEPTGALDSKTAQEVTDCLFDVVKNNGATLILATHDLTLAQQCKCILKLDQARLIDDTVV